MTALRLLTSSWWQPLPASYIRIGISRGTPRRGVSDYRMYRKLAPGAWYHDGLDPQAWEARYRAEVLDRLDPQRVHDELLRLADGQIPVLCCFEKAGGPSWCHRSLAALWLSEALGEVVPEFGHEGLPQDQHPLRPPL